MSPKPLGPRGAFYAGSSKTHFGKWNIGLGNLVLSDFSEPEVWTTFLTAVSRLLKDSREDFTLGGGSRRAGENGTRLCSVSSPIPRQCWVVGDALWLWRDVQLRVCNFLPCLYENQTLCSPSEAALCWLALNVSAHTKARNPPSWERVTGIGTKICLQFQMWKVLFSCRMLVQEKLLSS